MFFPDSLVNLCKARPQYLEIGILIPVILQLILMLMPYQKHLKFPHHLGCPSIASAKSLWMKLPWLIFQMQMHFLIILNLLLSLPSNLNLSHSLLTSKHFPLIMKTPALHWILFATQKLSHPTSGRSAHTSHMIVYSLKLDYNYKQMINLVHLPIHHAPKLQKIMHIKKDPIPRESNTINLFKLHFHQLHHWNHRYHHLRTFPFPFLFLN